MSVYGGQVTGQKKDIGSSIAQLATILEQNKQARVKKAADTWGIFKDLVTNQYGGNYAAAFRDPGNETLVKQFLRFNVGGAIPNTKKIDEMYGQLKTVRMTSAQNMEEMLLAIQRGDFSQVQGSEDTVQVEAPPAPAAKTSAAAELSTVAPEPEAAPSASVEAPEEEAPGPPLLPQESRFDNDLRGAAADAFMESWLKESKGKTPGAMRREEIINGAVNRLVESGMPLEMAKSVLEEMIGQDMFEIPNSKPGDLFTLAADNLNFPDAPHTETFRARALDGIQKKFGAGPEQGPQLPEVDPRLDAFARAKPASAESGAKAPAAKVEGNPATAGLRAGLEKRFGPPTSPGGYPLAVYQRVAVTRPDLFDPPGSLNVKSDPASQNAFTEEAAKLLPSSSSPSSSSSSSASTPPVADAASPAATSARPSSLFYRSKNVQAGETEDLGPSLSSEAMADLSRKSGVTAEGVNKAFETAVKDPSQRSLYEEGQAKKVVRAAQWSLSRQGEELRARGGKIGDLDPERARAFLQEAQEGIADWRDNPVAMDLFFTKTVEAKRKLTLEERQFEEARTQFDRSIDLEMRKIGLEYDKLDAAGKAAALEAWVKMQGGNVDTSLIEKFSGLYMDQVKTIPGYATMSADQKKSAIAALRDGDGVFAGIHDILLRYSADTLGVAVGTENVRALRGNATLRDQLAQFISVIFSGQKYSGTTTLPVLTDPVLEKARGQVQAFSEQAKATADAAKRKLGIE